MSLFTEIFAAARNRDAMFSDVLVHADASGAQLTLRTESQEVVPLIAVSAEAASASDWLAAARAELPLPDAWAHFERDGDIDFSVQYEGELMRVCLARAQGRICLVMRQRRGRAPAIEDIGLPIDVSPWLARSNGLILVCGATGAGKSTTLAAMIEHINARRPGHFVTVEDPIEYLFRADKCVFTQRSVGADVSSFARGVRAAMRQSPQFLLVGEIRDGATLEAALHLGESGQLVLATMHATNCERALERIEALCDGNAELVRSQLAGSLIGIVAQTLLRGVDGRRVLAAEVMTSTPSIAACVRGGKTTDIKAAMRNPPDGEPQVRLALSLAGLVRSGLVDKSVAKAAAYDGSEFEAALVRNKLPMPFGSRNAGK